MTEVMNMAADESIDARREGKETSVKEPHSSPPPPPVRRWERDDKERRDDRDLERPQNRRAEISDRNRSSPLPPPLRERDIDRDYKRRSSHSPPPPYRDRIHSPPRRTSPPPYKRSRRDDGGGYEGRRGSPRGGFGPGDRRFGFDYGGGNDRDMRGRPGYADERPLSRFIGRLSGGHEGEPSEWDTNRETYNDVPNNGNAPREGLMSYKQFIQELEDDILPSEAERRYQEYKSEYISTQKRVFFDVHKDEEWLKDKYHPTNLVSVIERKNELARRAAKEFLLDLQSGTLDLGPSINTSSSSKPGQTSEPNSDEDIEKDGKRRRFGKGQTHESDSLSAAPMAHPVSSEPRRIRFDMERAQAIIGKLDTEKGIEENILCRTESDKISRERSHSGSSGPVIILRGLTYVKGLEGIELLDTLITYLWRIHGVDYYGMVEMREAKGLRHIRPEGKSSDTVGNGVEWEKKLESYWEERLKGQDPLEIMTGKENIEAASDPYIRKIKDEKYGWKYGCGAKGCTKLFHAPEYVHKHLKLKHPDLAVELTSKVCEDLYYQNYMNDADAPGGTPVMQQPLPKDELQRRRMALQNRLKDDRGDRRERDIRAGVGERYVRSGADESNNDDADGGHQDEPIYDSFGGQGVAVRPSVLMPVPGAGPLGPFVPVPPKMRMLREQGGPAQFEGSGRNGRSASQLNGRAPIIASSSGFRQDPRGLRSYQDLDAPEDEVTVIDYRSL